MHNQAAPYKHSSQVISDTHQDRLHRAYERLNELNQLAHGWLDGEGFPVAEPALTWARGALPHIIAHTPDDVYIFPTPEGGLQIEWQSGSTIFSCEYSAADDRLLADQTDTSTQQFRTSEHPTDVDIARLLTEVFPPTTPVEGTTTPVF